MTSYQKNIRKSLNSQKIKKIRIQILKIEQKNNKVKKKCNKKNIKIFLQNNTTDLIVKYHINLREYQFRKYNFDESI